MNTSLLINEFKNLDIVLSEKQIQQFNKYYEFLVEKNKVMNLTAITEYNEVVIKHFLDSCLIIKLFNDKKVINEFSSNMSLLDLGTGAGFPGIPLKIVFPDMKITLMDSLNKRINFLNDVIDKLNLNDCIAIHARAEEVARKEEYREKFDFVVSRAVAKLNTLSEFCIPFLRVNGYFIPYKSSNAREEISQAEGAIKTLGCNLIDVCEIPLSNTDIVRLMPIIKKNKATPDKYPRVGRKAEKNPL